MNKRDWGDLQATSHALQLRGFDSRVVDYGTLGDFPKQLNYLRTVDIFVSSVGTAITSSPFLGHGSVVVNVGWKDGFWEEYLVAGIPWLRTVYPESLAGRRSTDSLVKLVQAAQTIILNKTQVGPQLSDLGKATAYVMQRCKAIRLTVNFQTTKMCYPEYGPIFSFSLHCGTLTKCAPLSERDERIVHDARRVLGLDHFCAASRVGPTTPQH